MTAGGIIERATAVPVSNVMIVCPTCKLPTRIGYTTKEIKGGETIKVRVCKRDGLRRGARLMAVVRDLRPAPQAALQRRAPRGPAGAARPLVDHAGRRRVSKITLNMGVGEAKTDAKVLDAAMDELTIIAGQRAQMRRARKSVAQFKIREGMPIGCRVTLRGDRMWEFLDRLISIALPRIRDFRGLPPTSFDGRGNYSLGLREQIIFPEIDYDSIKEIRGLDVAITTTAETDEQAEALLRGLGLPIATEAGRD